MADKKPAPKPEGISFIPAFFFLFFIFLALNGLFSSYFSENSLTGNSQDLEKNKNGFWSRVLPKEEIKIGANVANTKDVDVRNAPAGQILGIQTKGQNAKILEGPISKFGLNWWRVDYQDIPDGWVTSNDLTVFVAWSNFLNFFPMFFGNLQKVLILFGLIAFILIIILNFKLSEIRKNNLKKKELLQDFKKEDVPNSLPVSGLPVGEKPVTQNVSNRSWKNIQHLIGSYNLNDWKQAILEADVILDQMLDKMGYHGETVGDKLKQIESSDFLTLNQAWEAHKVRNQIAHQGSNYILSKDEAEKVINLYEQVFKEFYFI